MAIKLFVGCEEKVHRHVAAVIFNSEDLQPLPIKRRHENPQQIEKVHGNRERKAADGDGHFTLRNYGHLMNIIVFNCISHFVFINAKC